MFDDGVVVDVGAALLWQSVVDPCVAARLAVFDVVADVVVVVVGGVGDCRVI